MMWSNAPTTNILNADTRSIVGRHKVDGSPLEPIQPSSHVAKSNPHRAGTDDEQRRLLRRGYGLVRPYGTALGRGLLFLGFARSLTTQPEFVRRAWINNHNFPTSGAGRDQLLFGGYYFVPPLTKPRDLTSWTLPTVPSTDETQPTPASS